LIGGELVQRLEFGVECRAPRKEAQVAGKKESSGRRPEPSKPSWQQALLRRAPRVKGLDGVFYGKDSVGVCHVYWVMQELFEKVTERVLRQERLITKEFPKIPFYFHLWVHQGREIAKTVPRGLKPLFVRHER
jgi:hypothetical protein